MRSQTLARPLLLAAGLLLPAVPSALAHARLKDGRTTGGSYAFTVAAADGVRVDQPWARATAPQQRVGGAYMTLTSPSADRLVGASTPVAGRVEIHEMSMDGSIMRMRELPDGLPLPAGRAVALAPGGYHIMLMDLKQPLIAGQAVPLQLRFGNAPPQDVQLRVAPVGARGPDGAGAGRHGSHGSHGAHE